MPEATAADRPPEDTAQDALANPGMDAMSSEPTTGPPAGGSGARLTWLHQELGRQLAIYRSCRNRDKRKAFGLQMATVTLSATITVLLGLRVTGVAQDRLAEISLAFGAMITVLAAWEVFFAHRGLWILRTETVRNLEAFARHLAYYQVGLDGQQPDPAAVDALNAELDSILTADHTTWQHLRATASTTRDTSDTTAINSQPGVLSQ